MKKLALVLALLLVISLVPVGAVEVASVEAPAENGGVATLSAGTPTPAHIDDDLGELMAYFNFDEYDNAYDLKGNGWHFNYLPTYKSTNMGYAVVGTNYVYGLDAALHDGTNEGLGGIVFIPSLETESGLGGLFNLEGMPAGINTLKFKILVPSVDPSTGDPVDDSTLRTYYNSNGDYIDWTPAATTAGANANRDTWQQYSRTLPGATTVTKWQFYSYASSKDIIDDVEIWCYPSNGFILRQAADSDNAKMVLVDGSTYTFPVVATTFVGEQTLTAWTDGNLVFQANDETSASNVLGKTFYPCAGNVVVILPTDPPAVKVNETLGELVAFFNFDNANYKLPTYAKYAVKIADAVNDEALVGPSDDARFPTKCIDFELLTDAYTQAGGYASIFNVVKNYNSELPAWPDGKQTIKLQVMARSDHPACSSRTYYNGNGELAYAGGGPLASGANSGANANRDEWRTYSRTTEANIPGTWNFFYYNNAATFADSYSHEVIDDIEIWCYPNDGFILKESAADSTNLVMERSAAATYTMPDVPASATNGENAWTNDGATYYYVGTAYDTSALYGKSFYPVVAPAPVSAPTSVAAAATNLRTHAALRFTATSGDYNTFDAFGFLLSRKDSMQAYGFTELTHETQVSGQNLYIEAMCVDATHNRIYADDLNGTRTYSVLASIPAGKTDITFVARPFALYNNSYLYGAAMEGCYDTLSA